MDEKNLGGGGHVRTRGAACALFLAAFIALLFLNGCAKKSDERAAAQNTQAAEQPISFTDQRGKTISLPRPAQRIVALPTQAASLIMALDGSADRVIAMHSSAAAALQKSVLAEIFPAARGIASGISNDSFTPNVESIAALAPDLVVQWGWDDGTITPGSYDGPDSYIDPLENAGLTVAGLYYKGTQEELELWMDMLSKAIGKPERGQQIISWHKKTREAMRNAANAKKTSGKNAANAKPRVLVVSRFGDTIRVSCGETYASYFVSLAGGQNVCTEAQWQITVSLEQILQWNPEIILLNNYNEATPADVYAAPLWNETAAAKNRRVYKIPSGGYRWGTPNQESPLMWQWLAALVDRDANKKLALRGAMREAYQLLYGYELSNAQIDGILHVDINKDSAGYAALLAR